MSRVKAGFLAVGVTCLMGASTAAWACEVSGRIVCSNDPTVGVSGVGVSLASYVETVSTSSASDGRWGTHVNFTNMEYVLNLTGETLLCDGSGTPISVAPIPVDDPVQCPGEPPPPPPPPPPPACVPTMPAGIAFPYCPARPLGNTKAECDLFGLAVLDKDDISGGPRSVTADQTAILALVKAGGCYDVFLNVLDDVTVLRAPYTQGISHVTYCVCK